MSDSAESFAITSVRHAVGSVGKSSTCTHDSSVESSAEGGPHVCSALLETVGKRLARGEIAATNALFHAAKS